MINVCINEVSSDESYGFYCGDWIRGYKNNEQYCKLLLDGFHKTTVHCTHSTFIGTKKTEPNNNILYLDGKS